MGVITASVGELAKAKNRKADVLTVQKLLNDWIGLGLLNGVLPLVASGICDAITIAAIREFQRSVVKLAKPDGVIGANGPTIAALASPPDPSMPARVAAVAVANAGFGTLGGIDGDLWQLALNRMIKHSTHAHLKIPDLITIVDFRLSRRKERLWVVDLAKRKVLFKTYVAHGGGTKTVGKQGDIAKNFSNAAKTHLSCVGSFITRHTWGSGLGGVSGTAMGLRGIETTCTNAQSRGIHFHGAKYVKATSVGNSHGCFATPPVVNEDLVKVLRNGSFVYAYGGATWNTA